MEQWKMSVITGVALIILALLFSFVKGSISIWMGIVIVLGVIDIIIGILRKKKEGI
ncbi:hypothetical protein [Methanobrevibacter thaueri]|uniref:hypothetical protein n=1 Tax=Methanobrevibacter thaueri TaxID=190975 RepID=UPI0026EDE7F3|nr:hypothetical protein [Methanobrevibacter thaueri]